MLFILFHFKKRFDEKTKTLKNIETSINEATLKNNQLKEEQTKLDSLLKEHYLVLEEKDKASSELKNICEDLNFEFNGRDCSISGTIYDEIHREKIVATIKSINGIRNVTDDLEVLQLALPELRIEKSGEPSNLIWKIEGIISDGPKQK